nr:hypothetical protein [Tanacetum cinerariifolium]
MSASSKAKDVVADTTRGLVNTAVGAGQKGASYVGNTTIKGKDITLEARKTTAEYAGKAAGKAAGTLKDTAVSIAKLAGDTATGVTETVGNVSREVGKAGWNAAEYVGDKAMGATETMGNMTRGATRLVGDTAVATKDKKGGMKTDNSASAKVRGESGGYKVDTRTARGTNKENFGQQGTGGAMSKGGSGHQVSGGKVVGGGHEYQGRTGASVVRVTRETVEIKKDMKDAKQRRGG